MPGAREVLAQADEMRFSNFVYTHKGTITFTILRDLVYFTKTSQSGFWAGPSPQAAELIC